MCGWYSGFNSVLVLLEEQWPNVQQVGIAKIWEKSS